MTSSALQLFTHQGVYCKCIYKVATLCAYQNILSLPMHDDAFNGMWNWIRAILRYRTVRYIRVLVGQDFQHLKTRELAVFFARYWSYARVHFSSVQLVFVCHGQNLEALYEAIALETNRHPLHDMNVLFFNDPVVADVEIARRYYAYAAIGDAVPTTVN